MEVRCKYRDLDWRELRPGWMPGVNLSPCRDDFIPPPSRWQIAPIQVPYQLQPGRDVSLNTTHAPFSSPSKPQDSCLTSIHVLIFATHFHPGDVSAPSRFQKLHANSIHLQSQTLSKPQDVHLTPIKVLFHLHLGPEKYKSTPPRSHFKPILVSGCVSNLQLGPASPASKYQNYCLISIHVLAHFHPSLNIPVSLSPMYNFTSTMVTIFASHLQSCHVSPTTKYRFLCLTFIWVTFNRHVGH